MRALLIVKPLGQWGCSLPSAPALAAAPAAQDRLTTFDVKTNTIIHKINTNCPQTSTQLKIKSLSDSQASEHTEKSDKILY